MGCSNLSTVTVDADNSYYTSVNNAILDKAQTYLYFVVPGLTGEYVVPSTVTKICEASFSYCTKMTAIQLPEGLKDIDSYAFYM